MVDAARIMREDNEMKGHLGSYQSFGRDVMAVWSEIRASRTLSG
jgi:hypothetical protein